MGKLRAAIIGTGMVATEAHAPAYKSAHDKVELVAVCDTLEERALAFAKRYQITGVYTDAEEMLRREKPDLVSITTPNTTHVALTRLALEMGANVLCEKPLAISYLDAKELFELAQNKGLVLVTCQTNRFTREYWAAHEYVSQGVLGTPYFGEVSHVRRRGVPTWGNFLSKEKNGGGALADIGVHVLDGILWMMGSPEVKGVIGKAARSIIDNEKGIRWSRKECGMMADPGTAFVPDIKECNVEEFATGMILTDGPSLNFKVSWAANMPTGTKFTILGDKAGLQFPDMQIYSSFGPDQADIKPRIFAMGPYDQLPFSGHYYLIHSMMEVLQSGASLPVKPNETLNTVAAIELFYRSCETGNIANRADL